MKSVFKAFPFAFKMIFSDPVNILLAVVPTVISLAIYLLAIAGIYRNSDFLASFLRNYVAGPDQATILANILTAILIIFVFFLMSWTFVLAIGIVSSPFNSLLSARIEQKLVQRIIMDDDHQHALIELKKSFGDTLKNEFKKIALLALVGLFVLVLNLIPLLYPVAAFLIASLLAVQFVDYSWSRHNLSVSACLKDVMSNILPYSLGGAIFLTMVAIPFVNALLPSLATSYFTVLWLSRHKKIEIP